MITDSPVSWGIMTALAIYGFVCWVRMVAAADAKRYGGDPDVW